MRAENRAGLGHMLTSTLTADKMYSADTCSWPMPGANIIRQQRLHVYKGMRDIEDCSFRCDTGSCRRAINKDKPVQLELL